MRNIRPITRHAIFERRLHACAGFLSFRHAAGSLVRGLPLFVSSAPKTPLRALCIVAFDVVHRLRRGTPLPAQRVRTLAALLDFGACANAAFDGKRCCRRECRAALRALRRAGAGPSTDEYVRRLRELETTRPATGGDARQFRNVRRYREDVARLSLGMVAATSGVTACLESAILATFRDTDLRILLRIVMLCQIIDDVLDYSRDRSAGLPSFLTSTETRPQAFERTWPIAQSYADTRELPPRADLWPLRAALRLVSACANAVILLGRWWSRIRDEKAAANPSVDAAASVSREGRMRSFAIRTVAARLRPPLTRRAETASHRRSP